MRNSASRIGPYLGAAALILFLGACASGEFAQTAQVTIEPSAADPLTSSTTTTTTATTTTAAVAQPEGTTSTTSTTETPPPPETTSTPETTLPASSTSTSTTTPTTTSTTAVSQPDFGAEIFEISGPIAARLEHSWREGCPVGLDELRLITTAHWDYDGNVASGELVVHADHADDIVQVLSRLFDAQFPIERMELVDNFLGDDDLSMEANNTSAFNCREIASNPGVWSNHAFGAAIDINPVANPYLRGNTVLPPAGIDAIDRSVEVQGGVYAGDAVTQAFAEIGWGWGGEWNSVKDWQHFSASGN